MKSIFVSSTFRDMQAERDMLHLEVMPRLQEKAREYGERISFTDLRWGVNTSDLESEEGARKVLSVCLNEIDKCRPYMLVFLGERYGWIPEGHYIKQAADEKNFSLEDLEESVTALEILYGSLSDERAVDRTVFCIREPLDLKSLPKRVRQDFSAESEWHSLKLKELKERIGALENAKIITYRAEWKGKGLTGLQDLADKLCLEFFSMFQAEWKVQSEKSWQDKEKLQSKLYLEEIAESYTGYGKVMDLLEKVAGSTIKRVFSFVGKPGTGKSCILGKLYRELHEEYYRVLPIVCGFSSRSDELGDILKQMAYFLENLLNIPHFEIKQARDKSVAGRNRDEIEQWISRITILCRELENYPEKKAAILIDGMEKLQPHPYLKNNRWLSLYLPENLTIYTSFDEDFQYYERMDDGSLGVVFRYQALTEIGSLSDKHKEEIIRGILSSSRKDLSHRVIQAIIQKQGSDNPFYIRLLIRRLLIMNREDFWKADTLGSGSTGLDARMLQLIDEAPGSLTGMSRALIKEAAVRCNEGQAVGILQFIAHSRKGLRDRDLEALIQRNGGHWNALDFSRLLRYMHDFFIVREDGRIDFIHSCFRKGIIEDYRHKSRRIYKSILEYIKTLPLTDALVVEESFYYAILLDDKAYCIELMQQVIGETSVMDETARAIKTLMNQKELGGKNIRRWFDGFFKSLRTVNIVDQGYIYKYIMNSILLEDVTLKTAFIIEDINVYIAEYIFEVLESPPFYEMSVSQKDVRVAAGFQILILQIITQIIDGLLIVRQAIDGLKRYSDILRNHDRNMKILKSFTEIVNKVTDEMKEELDKWCDKWKAEKGGEALERVEGLREDIDLYRLIFSIYTLELMSYNIWLHISAGRYEEGEKLLEEAGMKAEAFEDSLDYYQYQAFIAESRMDLHLARQGTFFGMQQLKKEFEKTEEYYYKYFGDIENVDNPLRREEYCRMRIRLAGFLIKMNAEKALDYCRETAEYAEKQTIKAYSLGNSSNLYEALVLLGVCLYQKGEYDEAERCFTKADFYEKDFTEFISPVIKEIDIYMQGFIAAAIMNQPVTKGDDTAIVRFFIPISSDNWKICKNYIKMVDEANKSSKSFFPRQYLECLLMAAAVMAESLAGNGCLAEAVNICEEAINIWRDKGGFYFPVMMTKSIYRLIAVVSGSLGRLDIDGGFLWTCYDLAGDFRAFFRELEEESDRWWNLGSSFDDYCSITDDIEE